MNQCQRSPPHTGWLPGSHSSMEPMCAAPGTGAPWTALYSHIGGAAIRPTAPLSAAPRSHQIGLSSPIPLAKCQIESSVISRFHGRTSISWPMCERISAIASSVIVAAGEPVLPALIRPRSGSLGILFNLPFGQIER